LLLAVTSTTLGVLFGYLGRSLKRIRDPQI